MSNICQSEMEWDHGLNFQEDAHLDLAPEGEMEPTLAKIPGTELIVVEFKTQTALTPARKQAVLSGRHP